MYAREQFGESDTCFLKLRHANFYYSFLLSKLLVAKMLCMFVKMDTISMCSQLSAKRNTYVVF